MNMNSVWSSDGAAVQTARTVLCHEDVMSQVRRQMKKAKSQAMSTQAANEHPGKELARLLNILFRHGILPIPEEGESKSNQYNDSTFSHLVAYATDTFFENIVWVWEKHLSAGHFDQADGVCYRPQPGSLVREKKEVELKAGKDGGLNAFDDCTRF